MVPKPHPWAYKFIPQPIKRPRDEDHLAEIRQAFKDLAALLDDRLPNTNFEQMRYRDRVLDHLEAAAMYATKGFTHG